MSSVHTIVWATWSWHLLSAMWPVCKQRKLLDRCVGPVTAWFNAGVRSSARVQ
jgi:hypothetical protein